MPVEVILPRVDMDMSDAVLGAWMVKEGDAVRQGDVIFEIETSKANMEVESPASGILKYITAESGKEYDVGTTLAWIYAQGEEDAPPPRGGDGGAETTVAEEARVEAEAPDEKAVDDQDSAAAATDNVIEIGGIRAMPRVRRMAREAGIDLSTVEGSGPEGRIEAEDILALTKTSSSDSPLVQAGPAVRQLARELGVNLAKVAGTGRKGVILKEDVHAYVKQQLAEAEQAPTLDVRSGDIGIPAIPEIDFSQFGDVELEKMSKIQRVTAENMTRCWLNVPHVTQFDEVDITELERFRKSMKAEAEKTGIKLTPLPFLLKACAAALKAHPRFNVSLHADGQHIVHKKYVHIGVAMDTPAGLVVPVVRDVDQKSIYQLSREVAELGNRAKERKLKPAEMQGACFTISSLGGIGGTGFTPIVNAPEVAILGVARADVKPVWNGSEFMPRTMLPLALSYDHRAINGGDAGRFMTFLGSVLVDIRRLVL